MHTILMVDDTKGWWDYNKIYTTQEKRDFLQNVSIYIGNNIDDPFREEQLCKAELLDLDD